MEKIQKEVKIMKIAVYTTIGVIIGTLVASIILPIIIAIFSLPIPWDLFVMLEWLYELL
jgi:type II secretory pathway component PulF